MYEVDNMCLAVPVQVEEIFDDGGLRMAKINFGGIRKSICLEYLPEAVCGDYVLLHVGFAISIIDREDAKQTLALLQASGALEQARDEVGIGQ
jgi:hydrogenase expression/formation protein HypC